MFASDALLHHNLLTIDEVEALGRLSHTATAEVEVGTSDSIHLTSYILDACRRQLSAHLCAEQCLQLNRLVEEIVTKTILPPH